MTGRAAIALARRLLPQHCALCAAASGDALLCATCVAELPVLPASCPQCALPSPSAMRCGACLAHPPPFVGALAAIAYAYPGDRLIQRLKYGGRLALAVPLAELLAATVRERIRTEALPDALVPVPLSLARQRERGFNQAAEIARAASRQLDRPVLHALERHRDAPAQSSLPRRRRVANVRGAFRCVAPVRGLSLALVDDVMTTGATLIAAATALNGGGARRVEAWAVARTLSVR